MATAPKTITRSILHNSPRTPTRTATLALKGLLAIGEREVAASAARFFKNSANEKFIGVNMPTLRAIARDMTRNMRDAGIEVALPLLKSSWHEARSLALILLVRQFKKGDTKTQALIYKLYLNNSQYINNWDLVDMSAEHIVGAYLADKPLKQKTVLTKLAKSASMWERRIAIMATFHAIKRGEYKETFRIAELLLNDDEDLIQKPVGWMLREVGKRIGVKTQESFMRRTYQTMPRTMLRYAIERFTPTKRKRYLLGLI
jgi:3-methyladenine DNA glycosylase AlkD